MKRKLLFVASLIPSLFFSQVGVNTSNPTETLDVAGIERIRELPKHNTNNSIFTKPDGTRSESKDQVFTATKTLVADANGILGYMEGLPTTNDGGGLPIGQAIVRIYTVPANIAIVGSFNLKSYLIANNLPALPSIDGLEMNISGVPSRPSYYDPRIYNISNSSKLVSFQSFATVGNENKTSLNNNLLPNNYLQVDANEIVFWTTANAEVETTNLQVQIDSTTYRWYEFKWWCMEVTGEKKIFMSVTRKA